MTQNFVFPDDSPFIIAEMSGNHNGSLDRALDIVRSVASSGAHALKIQTYTADTITLDVDRPEFRMSDDHVLWGGRRLYDLYREAHTPWEWHKPIFDLAKELGLVAFSSPFDETAVEFLEDLGVPIYKVASLEIVDIPLIEMIAQTGKPMIISTGTATLAEISEAVQAAQSAGAEDITLLLCTSSYPADPADANLLRMEPLRDIFGVKVGLSDHTMGVGVSVAATALGATVIEKHVTLDRHDGGVDSAFSLEPEELELLVTACKQAFSAVGDSSTWDVASEDESKKFRPSLFVSRNVAAGELVSLDNVRSVRPSGGLPPSELKNVLGRVFRADVSFGTPLSWDIV
jgi:pseudaminic acid synthase